MKQAKNKASKQKNIVGSSFFFGRGGAEWVAFLSPHVACNQAVRRCGKHFVAGCGNQHNQPSCQFSFYKCTFVFTFPLYIFIYLFLYLRNLKRTAWLAHFPFPFLISRSPFAFLLQLQLQLYFPFPWAKKSNAKQTFHCLLEEHEEKTPKFFCNAAAEPSWKCTYVCVCGTWHVLNWIYTCAELIRVPCNDVFQFQLAAAAADVPQESKEKQHEAKKKTIVLSAHASRLWNTLPSMWETLAVDKLRHVLCGAACHRVQAAECVTFFNWVTGLALELWFTLSQSALATKTIKHPRILGEFSSEIY